MAPIKDVNEGASDAAYALFDEVSVRFMRAVKSNYGREVAVDVLNHLQTTLGKEWMGRVVFHMMADNYKSLEEVTVHVDPANPNGIKKINAIKALRWITGYGLSESKVFIEDVIDRRPRTAKLSRPSDMEQAAWDKRVGDGVAELMDAGFKVQIA